MDVDTTNECQQSRSWFDDIVSFQTKVFAYKLDLIAVIYNIISIKKMSLINSSFREIGKMYVQHSNTQNTKQLNCRMFYKLLWRKETHLKLVILQDLKPLPTPLFSVSFIIPRRSNSIWSIVDGSILGTPNSGIPLSAISCKNSSYKTVRHASSVIEHFLLILLTEINKFNHVLKLS